jgi:hypothetical protein
MLAQHGKAPAKGAHLKHSLLAEPLWSAERGFAAVAPDQSPPHSPAPLEGGGGAVEGYSRGTLLSGYVRRSALMDVWLKAQCAADGLERSAVERAALGWGQSEQRKGERAAAPNAPYVSGIDVNMHGTRTCRTGRPLYIICTAYIVACNMRRDIPCNVKHAVQRTTSRATCSALLRSQPLPRLGTLRSRGQATDR